MLSNSTPVSIGPFALEKQPYDPVDGFTHIALIGTAPCVVMANPAAPIKTITDVEAQARKTGRLDFGSGGPASIGHIYGELMKKDHGREHGPCALPWRRPMTTDLIAGVVPLGIDVLTAFVPYFKSGQLVPLAVTSANRSPLVPDVPSVVEFGYRRWCWTTSLACRARPGCRPTWWRGSTPPAMKSLCRRTSGNAWWTWGSRPRRPARRRLPGSCANRSRSLHPRSRAQA
jgi:tripartite-type tricarboxylate transporter receptor subunit TctC